MSNTTIGLDGSGRIVLSRSNIPLIEPPATMGANTRAAAAAFSAARSRWRANPGASWYTRSTHPVSDSRRTASSRVIGPAPYEPISSSSIAVMSVSNGDGRPGSRSASASDANDWRRDSIVRRSHSRVSAPAGRAGASNGLRYPSGPGETT